VTGRASTIAIASLALVSITAGTMADQPTASAARIVGGYHALAGDFHLHSFPSTWSTLSPIDTVLEARHRGLDVIAMTPHERTWAGKLGNWFTRQIAGPIVIVGEEITAPRYHLLGVGISKTVPHGGPLADAIASVHAQGGVAIIAHPYFMDWLADDAPELKALDGAEIVRPETLASEDSATRLRAFFARGSFTAIGSSDFHGLGPMGFARTWVFAREATAEGVIDALREGRTVVYGRDRAYGNPELIALAEQAGLPHDVPPLPLPGTLAWFSRIGILIALAAVLLRASTRGTVP
jgi:predicted metal-dependent phosphoesterase TrpH